MTSSSLEFLISYANFQSFTSTLNGAALFINRTTPLVLDFCSFADCISSSYGGAIYADMQTSFTTSHSCFMKCSAPRGASIATITQDSVSKCLVTLSFIFQCTCSRNGCSDMQKGDSSLTHSNTSRCDTPHASGVIFRLTNAATISFCTFSYNSATDTGDIVCYTSTPNLVGVIESTNFIGNTADLQSSSYSGLITQDGENINSIIRITLCHFVSNTVSKLVASSNAEFSSCVSDTDFGIAEIEVVGGILLLTKIDVSICQKYQATIDNSSNLSNIVHFLVASLLLNVV